MIICGPNQLNIWKYMIKIIVDTQLDKMQLLEASRYLDSLRCIDSNHNYMVNFLMHFYCNPDLIEVKDQNK